MGQEGEGSEGGRREGKQVVSTSGLSAQLQGPVFPATRH